MLRGPCTRRYVSCGGLSPGGPFTRQATQPSPSYVFGDTNVQNEQTYCYVVVPVRDVYYPSFIDRTEGAPSSATCAVPKADPNSPHGYVVINDGVSVTSSPQVVLTLWASDEVDPPSELLEYPLPELGGRESGVTEMMISRRADMQDGVWEPYVTTKPWELGQSSGLSSSLREVPGQGRKRIGGVPRDDSA